MNPWFLDASVFVAADDEDDQNYQAAKRLLTHRQQLATLDLAFYEVSNVALRAWGDPAAAQRLGELVTAVADDGGLVRVDGALLAQALVIADQNRISVYDAAYAAAAGEANARLVSCDVRDLVSRGLALTPSRALRDSPGS